MPDHAEEIYLPVEPYALQSTQRVRTRPGTDEEDTGAFIYGTVVLVDSAAQFITVLFDHTTRPVAIPALEWCFQVQHDISHVPQEDGMYVREDEAGKSMANASALYVRKEGIWTNMLGNPAEPIDIIDLPRLAPLRAMPAPKAPAAAPQATPPTGSVPVIEEPPTVEP